MKVSTFSIEDALPYGAVILRDYAQRFRALGYDWKAAASSAARSDRRSALVLSRIELLPPSLRCSPLSHIIDVGANEGQWLSSFLQFNSARRIDVFEPNPEVLAPLYRAVAGLESVVVHNVALGADRSRMELNVTASSDLASMLKPSQHLQELYGDEGAQTSTITVPVERLDDLVPGSSPVDLLKLDVQGFEKEVLLGAPAVLKRARAVLIELNFQLHYSGQARFADLSNMLEMEFGFEFWDMSRPGRGPDGRAACADVVFVSPDTAEANRRAPINVARRQ